MGQAIFMILASFVSSSYGIIACIIISVTIGCFASAGFFVNYLDIAPRHASILMGMGHTIATIPGILSPNLTGWIVKNKVNMKIICKFCLYIANFKNIFRVLVSGELSSLLSGLFIS